MDPRPAYEGSCTEEDSVLGLHRGHMGQGRRVPEARHPEGGREGGLLGGGCCLRLPPTPRCLQPVLSHVQTLWELMLLGEPLVVLAPSPAMSSEMVLALTR